MPRAHLEIGGGGFVYVCNTSKQCFFRTPKLKERYYAVPTSHYVFEFDTTVTLSVSWAETEMHNLFFTLSRKCIHITHLALGSNYMFYINLILDLWL